MPDDRYTLNVNPEGHDVLHRHPSFEECNADDMSGRQRIDAETADALIAHDAVRRCGHCFGVNGDDRQ